MNTVKRTRREQSRRFVIKNKIKENDFEKICFGVGAITWQGQNDFCH